MPYRFDQISNNWLYLTSASLSLLTTEAAGVAEGYADAMEDWVSQGSTTADYVFGQYASKGSTGLRKYVYSTSNVTNPLRYSSLKGMTDAHGIPPFSIYSVSPRFA
ncbi:hypothetical protein EDB84DRAFT_1504727 [Lactarius hengduanensis]|nr:hypothetical protein EDB84DRAFT_1504727 [Lactarius hengduanensis]